MLAAGRTLTRLGSPDSFRCVALVSRTHLPSLHLSLPTIHARCLINSPLANLVSGFPPAAANPYITPSTAKHDIIEARFGAVNGIQFGLVNLVAHGRINLMFEDEREMPFHHLRLLRRHLLSARHLEEALKPERKIARPHLPAGRLSKPCSTRMAAT